MYMRPLLTVSSSIILGFVLVLSPILGMAAQRALTVDSLEKAYSQRILALNTEIAALNKAADEYPVPLQGQASVWERSNAQVAQNKIRAAITPLEEEKRSTEAAYDLLKEALK